MLTTETTARIGYVVTEEPVGHPDVFRPISTPIFADELDAQVWAADWRGAVDRPLVVERVELDPDQRYTDPDELEWVNVC